MKGEKVKLSSDPLWYKDAIIYELHIKSFMDSNHDGIGDIRGLISKLDYIRNLGVTAIWLLPFYPSPLKDDGYDIADYYDVHPAYGTLEDFKELLEEAHSKGLHIITELVLNHTSSQHEWFQKSRKAKKGSYWRNFYVWNDDHFKYTDARIIFNDFETSNWSWDSEARAYFWHRFYSHQPDLNFDNPEVHKQLFKIIDFWFDMGVDGLRLDAVPYLYEREGTNCENLPETHAFLQKLRKHVDHKYKDRMLLAEANQWTEDAVAYFGNDDECHMAFNFPIMPRMFMAIQLEDKFPLINILEDSLDIPAKSQWAIFLRNHDELTLEMVTDEEKDTMYKFYAQDPKSKINQGIRRRLAPLLRNNQRKIEIMNVLLFSLPGTPVIYYGDEICMGDNYYLGDRDGVRTPMQWAESRNAGFSEANPQRLYLPVIIDPEYHYESINVENQERNLSSVLWWMKRVIAMRKRYKAFGRGGINLLNIINNNAKILAFTREYEEEKILVVINISRYSQSALIDLSDYKGTTPVEVFSQNRFPEIGDDPYVVTMGPFDYFWFTLEQEKETAEAPLLDVLELKGPVEELFRKHKKFEKNGLLAYLTQCRWYNGKSRKVNEIAIAEAVPLNLEEETFFLLFLHVAYTEGIPETYFLILGTAFGEKRELSEEEPVIARLKSGEKEGILYDAVKTEKIHKFLFDLMYRKETLKTEEGSISGIFNKKLKKSTPEDYHKSALFRAEQSNTSIVYDQDLILKLYRKLDRGENPDTEIIRGLSRQTGFTQIPAYGGSIDYKTREGDLYTLGFLQGFIANDADAWSYTVDNVRKYFDVILSRRRELATLLEKEDMADYRMIDEKINLKSYMGDFFCYMVSVLGKRTGEMHIALSRVKEFQPEAFTLLYQKSLFQSVKIYIIETFRLLNSNLNNYGYEIKKEIKEVLEGKNQLIEQIKKITRHKIDATKIRVHGDYHLGQVLFTGNDFAIIDFEGEPGRPISDRKLKRSPLKDVTGMIRSFHYAAFFHIMQESSVREEDLSFLIPWAEVWYEQTKEIFLASYLEVVKKSGLIPGDREDRQALFDLFLLDKTVYELRYELGNRPEWLGLPLRGLKKILSDFKG